MKALFFAMAALALPLVASAQTVSVQTATGPAEVAPDPQKLVVLDFAAIDTLVALGVAIDARPDFQPPAYLQAAIRDVPTAGTLFDPDFEAIAVMAPDLIIAGGRSQPQVKALARFAPVLDMTIDAQDLIGQAEARITAYGDIFGRQDQAGALRANLQAAIDDTSAAVSGKGNALILLTNGGKISAYGSNSRFGWLHSALDLPEAYPGLKADTHGEAVSFEFVAEADPDWLLVIDRGAAVGQGGEAAAATLDNPLIAGTTAGQKGQIVYLDGAAIYLAGGGYQSLMEVLDQVKRAFAGVQS